MTPTPEVTNLTNVDQLHYWLELLYYSSGIILALVGIAALYQLRLAKKALIASQKQLEIAASTLSTAKTDIQTRVKREAIVLAANQCERFAKEIIPRRVERLAFINNSEVGLYKWTLLNDLFDETSIKEKKEAKNWAEKSNSLREVQSALFEIANDLEGFSIYFAQKAADEQVAFNAIGALFCGTVDNIAPFLIMIRKQQPLNVVSGPYQNLVEIYKIWSARRKRLSLEESANVHESEATRTREIASAIEVETILPYGVEK